MILKVPLSAKNKMSTAPKMLIDQHGRRVDYIRLSITDRCDFRCVYCMAESMTFLPRAEVLSLEECARLVRLFVAMGVSKVRTVSYTHLTLPTIYSV